MLVTALLTAHVNRWVIQLSSYCGVNELGSTVWVGIFALCVCVRTHGCVCAHTKSQTEAQRTDGGFRRRLTHRNQAITHSVTPSMRERVKRGIGGNGQKRKVGMEGWDEGKKIKTQPFLGVCKVHYELAKLFICQSIYLKMENWQIVRDLMM